MNQMLLFLPKTSLEKIHENKKQPNLQIAIMKAIALNGAMTKPKLAKMLNSKNTSIATTITKDFKNEIPLRLFEKLKDFELVKSIQQPLFQLTDFGMSMLLVSHFKKINNEKESKPILNYTEFSKLVSIFKQKHSNNFNDFKADKISEILVFYYLGANTTLSKKLSKDVKGNSELDNLKNKISSSSSEIRKLENDIKKLKRENKKNEDKIIHILSKELIKSL